jgi:esterase/lipase superfamily enzyme
VSHWGRALLWVTVAAAACAAPVGRTTVEPGPSSSTVPAGARTAIRTGPRWWDALDQAPVRTPVLIATTRAPSATGRPGVAFGTADGGSLRFADAVVSVPPYAVRLDGSVPTAADDAAPDITREFAVDSLDPVDLAGLQQRLRVRRASAPSTGILVYVHGFDKTFERAAARVAQLGADLGFDGPLVLFTWPSRGAITEYRRDQQTARAAGAALLTVLRALTADGAPVRLVTHSMGAEVLAAALADTTPGPAVQLADVVLLAPDIDADRFARETLGPLRAWATRVTIYASAHDEALRASHRLNAAWRLGLAGDSLRVLPGVVTIDASRVHATGLASRLRAGEPIRAGLHGALLDALGHDVFDNPLVLSDLRELLIEGLPPERRRLLAVNPVGRPRYWRFR